MYNVTFDHVLWLVQCTVQREGQTLQSPSLIEIKVFLPLSFIQWLAGCWMANGMNKYACNLGTKSVLWCYNLYLKNVCGSLWLSVAWLVVFLSRCCRLLGFSLFDWELDREIYPLHSCWPGGWQYGLGLGAVLHYFCLFPKHIFIIIKCAGPCCFTAETETAASGSHGCWLASRLVAYCYFVEAVRSESEMLSNTNSFILSLRHTFLSSQQPCVCWE